MSSKESLTASEILRRKVQRKRSSSSSSNESVVGEEPNNGGGGDIDDKIRRLEEELAKESDSDSDDSDDDASLSSSSAGKDGGKDGGKTDSRTGGRDIKQNKQEGGVLSLSTLEKDRIESLPSHLLPSNKKRSLKIDAKTEKKVPKKEKVDSGLESAVKEVLNGYVARSSERLPFYCRVCQKQYNNEQEFFGHKQTDFHKTAVEMERKASFCKLCKKQLTSPEQLKEHLNSRPHKERLERARSRNPPGRGR